MTQESGGLSPAGRGGPYRERSVKRKRQAYMPAAIVAVVAVLLQFGVLVTRPSGTGGASRATALRIDYGAPFGFVIRALDPSYIGKRLRGTLEFLGEPSPSATRSSDRRTTERERSSPKSSPSPTATPTPTPGGGGLISGTRGIALDMRVDRRSVEPGGLVVYEVTATNKGDRSVTTVYTIATHSPQFTLECQQATTASCTTPGTYDGSSSSPNDPHLLPPTTERTAMIPPHQTVVLRRLRVQVAPAAPSGTRLKNHAHADVVGDNASAKTVHAPAVVVR
jgi:hypothetical protein